MRKIFSLSWPQIILVLVIAGTVLTVPELTFLRFFLAGLLIGVAALGVSMKLTRPKTDPEHGPTSRS
ncbi:hypothetical protein SAMN04487917_11532 [Arthrobacter sp. yr096]|nr:hypothetical protein SAMN04487912_1169 [Arthrobacter sp. cf158]SEJ81660.1 hypothetical protein SAMN04487917_11532 [Arthrobacter sp. yr096]